MQPLDDSLLLRQFVENQSDEAFAALAERHINLVYSIAMRQVGNPHHAEEITQAVFVILAKKAAQLRYDKALSSWLFQTTRLTANNFVRGEIRRRDREKEAYMQSVLDEPGEDLWPKIAPLLDRAVADLREKDRQAILLRFYEGRNLRDVGEALTASEDAAEKRVTRALEKLRKFFIRHGVNSTTSAIAGMISTNSVQAAPAALAKTVTALAVAKGTAVSASTLTLITGTLKIMAWSKTKTAIIATVGILLATGATTIAIKAVNAARNRSALATMQGSWEGTLDVDKVHLRLVLNIVKTNDTYLATLDSVDQGAMGIPVTRLAARPDSLHAELPALDANYEGALNADKTEMSGTWKQVNRSFPLNLKRTTDADKTATLAPDEYVQRAGSDLQGAWEGSLTAGTVALHLNLRIAELTDGTFHAQMDSADQGAKNLPVTALTYDKPTVHFEMDAINGVFDGNVNGRDNEIAGTWTQMGKKLPLTFRRAQTNSDSAAGTEPDYGQGASYQVQGHWKGVLNVNHVSLHIVFHIAVLADGSYSTTMDSPDQGANGIPAAKTQFTYPNLRLEWPAINGVFTGKLDNGKLAGTWKQGTMALPLKLEREPAT